MASQSQMIPATSPSFPSPAALTVAFPLQATSILSAPQDVVQLIMSWLSPCDLQNLRDATRAFREVVNGPHSNNIWRHAFRNVLFSVPLPSLPPPQITSLAFRGGPCQYCFAHTLALPYSFSLNLRFCSLVCQYLTLRTVPSAVKASPALPTKFPGLEHRTSLPVVLPYLEGSEGPHLRPSFS
ncbi:hypothetical protein C8R47DRAFT_676796 [Mycena vitilis]|nr:hypothetical protein C8R47DRAFT_676796 [Mycena vitilis]